MKTRDQYPDLLTENQWLKKGYIIKPSCTGTELWTNRHYTQSMKYYSSKEVRKSPQKAEAILKAQAKKARERYKKKKKAMEVEQDLHDVWNTEYQWLQQGREPNKDARWKCGSELNHYLIQFGSNYYYCHIDDTHPIQKEEKACTIK